MGLLIYSFGFVLCVRVRCGLYPHGLTVFLFWFSPLCESLLWIVSTLAYCYTIFVRFLVQESVADCIHTGLLFHSFGLFLCVRVRCALYPNGHTVLLFCFFPLCESSLQTVSTWTYCFTLLVFSLCESPLWTVYT